MAKAFHGVCLDAMNAGGCPDPRELAMLGLNAARLVAFVDDRFYAYAQTLTWGGIKLALVMGNETFHGDWSSGDYFSDAVTVAQELKDRDVEPAFWVLGNEQDAWMLPVDSPSSWSLRPPEYAEMFSMVATGIQSVFPDARLVIGGFVAGQPSILAEYLAAIRVLYDGPIQGYDLHGYGKNAAEVMALFAAYDRFSEAGMWGLTLEWWRPAEEIPEYVEALGETYWTFFDWSDAMVPPFGLLDIQNWPKAEAHALAKSV